MNVWTKMTEPISIETYLKNSGWRKMADSWLSEQDDEVVCVQVPERGDPDYPNLVKRVVQTLAEVEGRTIAEIFNDIFPLGKSIAGVEVFE